MNVTPMLTSGPIKICPHCGYSLPSGQNRCPQCRTLYWDPSLPEDEEPEAAEEVTQGCFTLLGFFLTVAVSISLLLVGLGIVVQWLTHFADYQTRIIWLAASVLCGTTLAAWWARRRRRSEKSPLHPSSEMRKPKV